jgi:Putative MetA-pathway of phenol degradation
MDRSLGAHSRLAGLLGALLLSLGAATAAAQEPEAPLVANRPGFSSVAEVVPRGDLELNAGVGWSRVEQAETTSLGQVLLRAGLVRNVEVRLGLNSWITTDSPAGDVEGVEDPFVGVKIGLAPGAGRKPQSALIVEATLPAGSAAVGEDALQGKGTLVLAWNLSRRVHLDSNYAAASLSDAGDRYAELSTSFAFSISLVGKLAAYLEYAGFAPLEASRPDRHFGFAALTYLPSPRCQLDLGAGRGFNAENPDWWLSAGVAYRW